MFDEIRYVNFQIARVKINLIQYFIVAKKNHNDKIFEEIYIFQLINLLLLNVFLEHKALKEVDSSLRIIFQIPIMAKIDVDYKEEIVL